MEGGIGFDFVAVDHIGAGYDRCELGKSLMIGLGAVAYFSESHALVVYFPPCMGSLAVLPLQWRNICPVCSFRVLCCDNLVVGPKDCHDFAWAWWEKKLRT